MRKFVNQVAKTATEWKATCRSGHCPHYGTKEIAKATGREHAKPKGRWLTGFVPVQEYAQDRVLTDEIGSIP